MHPISSGKLQVLSSSPNILIYAAVGVSAFNVALVMVYTSLCVLIVTPLLMIDVQHLTPRSADWHIVL